MQVGAGEEKESRRLCLKSAQGGEAIRSSVFVGTEELQLGMCPMKLRLKRKEKKKRN